ncbi:hypothetical protein [Mycobacterium sp. ACS4054]|uniref:hypothetical protein n=1 Tax=Mycobacterium sp. ACS4054 TaxID=1834119 RepID=UPI0026F452B0|nr:hypothetical protein [Mycobacterium sp. ACS4054]
MGVTRLGAAGVTRLGRAGDVRAGPAGTMRAGAVGTRWPPAACVALAASVASYESALCPRVLTNCSWIMLASALIA